MESCQHVITTGMFRVRLSKAAKRRLRERFTSDPAIARIINSGMDSLTLEEFAVLDPLLKRTCVDMDSRVAIVFMVGQ